MFSFPILLTYQADSKKTQNRPLSSNGVTTEYNYQNGNITSVTQNGTAVKTYGYTDSSWGDLLTNFNGQTITYDGIGNPLQYRDGMSFTWAKGRQLQGITKDGLNASYTYDENGLRISKTVNGVTTKIFRQDRGRFCVLRKISKRHNSVSCSLSLSS